MTPYQLLAIYCLAIVAASLVGGALPSLFRISHTDMQVILSFVGGLMLGIGLLHMIPHGVAQCGNLDLVLISAMVGLLFMFFLIRAFHFHQHGPASASEEAHEDCGHDHDHHHHHDHGTVHKLSWIGVAIGMTVHTLIDGIGLGAAVISDSTHNPGLAFWGIGVFLAIALHQPLDAFSITSLMSASGWTRRSQMILNLLFSLMCPVGAAAFAFGLSRLGAAKPDVLGMVVGFSAGTFLCISLSDLLPEVQFHRHDRLKLSAALLAGVVAAYCIGLLEPSHAHGIPRAAAGDASEVTGSEVDGSETAASRVISPKTGD